MSLLVKSPLDKLDTPLGVSLNDKSQLVKEDDPIVPIFTWKLIFSGKKRSQKVGNIVLKIEQKRYPRAFRER